MTQSFWKMKDWEEEDRHLQQLKKMPFQRSFPALSLQKEGVYVIRGPRQVGKTSFLKTVLSHAVKQGKECFYQSCETLQGYQELLVLLQSLQHVEIIFLDEISFVSEWSRAVKYLVDSGSKQTFVITGSNANDLRKGLDLMPGRWGSGREIELLPMGFDEFSLMRQQAGFKKLDRVNELELYFRIGGFPLAVAESGDSLKVPTQAMTTYLQWIKGDIIKLGKIESYMKELMGQIARSMGSTLSLQTLASKTQMGSHHTALEYIQILETCFALKTLYAIDPEEESFRPRKEKKFYFTDPLIYWIAFEWSGYKPPAMNEEKIAEMVAHEALSRKYKRFGYHSNKNGEIDFIFPKNWGIEVKWAETASNLSKTYFQIALPFKTVWTKHNFLKHWPDEKS